MPVECHPSASDIAYAERILLPAGASFDEERLRFIRNMETLDLLAVPGSGKTTALLAKLLILDRHLPAPDGSGILVLSHTNAAIDEIRERIEPHCTQLFRYPNFVGTIQRFVDEFLAIPHYIHLYGKLPVQIDDVAYWSKFKILPSYQKGFSRQESNRALYFLRLNRKAVAWSWINGEAVLTNGYGGAPIEFAKPRVTTRPENYRDWTNAEKDRVKKWLQNFKHTIMKSGYLTYEDAYFLANHALAKNTMIKSLLRRRFGAVFVDEMQDMERHQCELLEQIFFDDGAYAGAYQRIGDRNQSIYDGRIHASDEFWRRRETELEFNGSHRLGPILADVVSAFAVSPIRIDGLQQDADGSPVSIRPRLIVYSDTTVENVINRFATIVRELCDAHVLPSSALSRSKAICWTTKSEYGKTRLPNYHPRYSKRVSSGRLDHPSFADHLSFPECQIGSFDLIERSIVDGVLKVLKMENVVGPNGMAFNRQGLREFMVAGPSESWQAYQKNVYDWCYGIAQGQRNHVLQDIQEKLPALCAMFGCHLDNSKQFVFGDANNVPESASTLPLGDSNVVMHDGVRVEVTTVHAVKGETHAATLYMESFYEKGGGGNYESERLSVQFAGQPLEATMHDLVRQSAKMVYVGFSRPTHLLCFALHESRFQRIEASLSGSVWDIERL
jgi:DNA helicase-2/ATP-dependent DNA helicase PcrA